MAAVLTVYCPCCCNRCSAEGCCNYDREPSYSPPCQARCYYEKFTQTVTTKSSTPGCENCFEETVQEVCGCKNCYCECSWLGNDWSKKEGWETCPTGYKMEIRSSNSDNNPFECDGNTGCASQVCFRCVPDCVYGPWSPQEDTVCEGRLFKQKRSLLAGSPALCTELERDATGTKDCSGLGACCTGGPDPCTRSCANTTEQECYDALGSWFKDEYCLAPGNDTATVGACGEGRLACCKDGDCQYVTACECQQIGGVYSGSNVLCEELSDNPECSGGDQDYYRVTGLSTRVNGNPSCTTTPGLAFSSDCIYGSPTDVARQAVSGSVSTVCPSGNYCENRAPSGNWPGGFVYMGGGVSSVEFGYEDCNIAPLDLIVTVTLEVCTPDSNE